MTQRIESLTNAKIKQLVRLLDSSKERKKEKSFVLEGLRLCLDCLNNSAIKAESLFFTEDCFKKNEALLGDIPGRLPSFVITEAIAKKLARTESSQGVFLLCRMPEEACEISPFGKYLALENVQSPDNFGAICRCAEAMGLDGIIVSGGVDVFNPKALRASMGSALRLNIIKADNLCEVLERLGKNGMKLFAAVPDSSALKVSDFTFDGGAVVIIGNEANGVSQEAKALCTLLTIPMKGRAESLNAAAAAAIIAWEMAQ